MLSIIWMKILQMNKKKEIENLRKENGLLIAENALLQHKIDLFEFEQDDEIEKILSSLVPGHSIVILDPCPKFTYDPWKTLGEPLLKAKLCKILQVFRKSFFIADETGTEYLILFMNIRNGEIKIIEVLPPQEQTPIVRIPSLGLPRLPFNNDGPSRTPHEWETTTTGPGTDDFEWIKLNETNS